MKSHEDQQCQIQYPSQWTQVYSMSKLFPPYLAQACQTRIVAMFNNTIIFKTKQNKTRNKQTTNTKLNKTKTQHFSLWLFVNHTIFEHRSLINWRFTIHISATIQFQSDCTQIFRNNNFWYYALKHELLDDVVNHFGQRKVFRFACFVKRGILLGVGGETGLMGTKIGSSDPSSFALKVHVVMLQ